MISSPRSLGLVPAIFNTFLDDEFDSILLSASMLYQCVSRSNDRGNHREQIECVLRASRILRSVTSTSAPWRDTVNCSRADMPQ